MITNFVFVYFKNYYLCGMPYLSFFTKKMTQLLTDFEKKTFLLAVSGGADSMALLELFRRLNSRIFVAHINYKLRGEASDLDQKLVEDYCKKHQIPYFIYEVSQQDQKPQQGSIQLWARELRYQFFHHIMTEKNIDYLSTAHHLNDQLETFLINLSRASGLAGLSGIPANENGILRPLLDFTKEDIYTFVKENNVPFREDASNQKNDYLRNKIRNIIVPELMKINPHFLQNFSKSLEIIQQNKNFVQEKVDNFLEENSSKQGDFLVINKKKLAEESDLIKFEILKKFSFENPIEIKKIFVAEKGKMFFSRNFCLKIEREHLLVSLKEKK